MHRQGHSPIGKALLSRVDDHIHVAARRRDADLGVRIAPDPIQGLGVHPESNQSSQGIVEGWLVHLGLDVRPRPGDDWQPLPIGEVLDKEIMLQLVRGLKDGRDHAVGGTQQYESDQNDHNGFVLCNELS